MVRSYSITLDMVLLTILVVDFFGCGYVYVVGYIKKYKALKNDEGLILSIISSIEESHRLKVEQVLKTREQVNQVVFFE